MLWWYELRSADDNVMEFGGGYATRQEANEEAMRRAEQKSRSLNTKRPEKFSIKTGNGG